MKIEGFKTFENQNFDENILENIVQFKIYISMLRDTINHVCNTLEKIVPNSDEYMETLKVNKDLYLSMDTIIQYMINGDHNIKDAIEEVELSFDDIEQYVNYTKRLGKS